MLILPAYGSLREVLFLGAHCDDIEIGCGGTLAALTRACPQVRLHIVVFSGNSVRTPETQAAIAQLLPSGAQHQLEIHEFRDGFFPVDWPHIKERFEAMKARMTPDLIFTHHARDSHQDHRVICELTWNTFRNHTVLEYEIPKYDGDLGQPSVFAPLQVEVVEHKLNSLLTCFPSQSGKQWFTRDVFAGLMRLRGMECNAASGFAEAFHARKIAIGF